MDKTNDNLQQALSDPVPVLYFHPHYLQTQQYSQVKVIRSKDFFVCFSIQDGIAKSLPRSPFGGIYCCDNNTADFDRFQGQIELELRQLNVSEILIVQPPPFYSNFVSNEHLQFSGYKPATSDTHQYLSLSDNLYDQLHLMEKRKLRNKDDFTIQKVKSERLPEIHDFIKECRKGNDLEINISLEKLTKLSDYFPGRYELFEARVGTKIAAAVVMTLPTADVAYYYLPASSSEYKSKSPMVSLIAYIYDYYRAKRTSFIDLGISSIEGHLQKSLFKFKERMGAKETERVSFVKAI